MRIAIASDLHLEFGGVALTNTGADVLVLAGDICVARQLPLAWFFEVQSVEPAKVTPFNSTVSLFKRCRLEKTSRSRLNFGIM